jgi:hypothetical protein
LELFATTLDWLADDFNLVYVDTTYTYSALHDRLADVGAGARQFDVVLAGKDATGGVLTASDPADQTPAAAVTMLGAWLYHDTGVEATSELLVWYDRSLDGATIEADSVLNPTTGDPLTLTLPAAPYGLLKL